MILRNLYFTHRAWSQRDQFESLKFATSHGYLHSERKCLIIVFVIVIDIALMLVVYKWYSITAALQLIFSRELSTHRRDLIIESCSYLAQLHYRTKAWRHQLYSYNMSFIVTESYQEIEKSIDMKYSR